MNPEGEHRPRGPAPVGRADALDAVAGSLLTDGVLGTLVIGDAGLGKTGLARAALAELGPRFKAFRISTSRSLASVPFGALAPFLDSLPAEAPLSGWHVTGALLEHLRAELADGEEALLVIDDAHDLDEGSADAVAQLVATGGVRLLALARPQPGPPAALFSLWRDGLLARYDLAPLGAAQSRELCEQVLGGPLLRASAALLHHAAGGNPMFLLAYLSEARRLGRLRETNGVWILVDHRPAVNAFLLDLVREQLLRLGEAEIEVLETAALAEPVQLSVLLAAGSPGAVDSLEEAGLIKVSAGPERQVALHCPLYAEVIRLLVPAGRSLALHRQVSALVDTGTLTGPALVRYVAWSLDCGSILPEALLLRAAREANRLFDTGLAKRAAGLVCSPEGAAAARVELARADFYRGDCAQAAAMLHGLPSTAADPSTIEASALLGLRVALREGTDPGELRLAAAAWKQAAGRCAAAGNVAAAAAAESAAAVFDLQALALDGRYQEAEEGLERLIAGPHSVFRVLALTLLAEGLTSAGRCDAGAAASERALELLGEHPDPAGLEDECVLVSHAFSLLQSGRFSELDAVLDGYLHRAPLSLVCFGGTVQLLEALADLRRGLMRAALEKLVVAVEALRCSDLAQLEPFAVSAAAYAASLLGRRDLTERYTAGFLELPAAGRRQLHLLARAHVLAAGAAVNSVSLTLGSLGRLREEALGHGLPAAALDIAMLEIRLGAQGAWEGLAELSKRLEGRYQGVLNDFAHAVMDRNPAALLRTGDDAADAGYPLVAAECAAHAMRYLQAGSDRRELRAASHRLQQLRPGLEGIATAFLALPQQTSRLTRREMDIATLVLNGAANREVAERLSLSLRTVEGHLYRIFSKLGINRREDLTASHLNGNGGVF